MVSAMIPLAVLIALMGMGSTEVTLPSYYFDGMVFQGDVSDNLIWGFTDNPDVEVLVEVACNGAELGSKKTLLRADPRFVYIHTITSSLNWHCHAPSWDDQLSPSQINSLPLLVTSSLRAGELMETFGK